MSTRRLAGSRRNKHLPIARRTLRNDRLPQLCEARASHYRRSAVQVAGYDPETAAVWRLIGTMFHDPAQGSRPAHAARAVDIHTIWPPLPADATTDVRRKAAEAGARGKSAAPMNAKGTTVRSAGYARQNGGRARFTARQIRRMERAYRRQLASAT